jgi:hypothetical protein
MLLLSLIILLHILSAEVGKEAGRNAREHLDTPDYLDYMKKSNVKFRRSFGLFVVFTILFIGASFYAVPYSCLLLVPTLYAIGRCGWFLPGMK